MSEGREPAALAHIEKTLMESYRKEIDQEENVWRSLPFFAATLALELAALFQVIDRRPSLPTWIAVPYFLLLAATIACSLGALVFLAMSVFPASFRYLAKDKALLDYALGLIRDEADPQNPTRPSPVVALHALKDNLAVQYAEATDNNRQINKRREARRSIAALLTLSSVIATLGLVTLTVATYVHR